MKTNLFSLAKVVLAAVASVVSMSSCSKNDNPYVIENPTPMRVVQSAKQAQAPKQTQKTEIKVFGHSEEFNYIDIIATTKDGQSYKIIAGAARTDIRQTDGAIICDMQAADFHPTSENTPVTVTFKKKEDVTFPETVSILFGFYHESCAVNSKININNIHHSAQSKKLDTVIRQDSEKIKDLDFSLRKDGKLVVFLNL